MHYRTLLLEDDVSLRRLLEVMLKRRGHLVASHESPLLCPLYGEVHCDCDGGLPCLDFLITDNRMPGMTGLEFIQLQAERGCRFEDQQKAIMSGTWREEERRLAQQLGFQVFRKPFNWNEFAAWLAASEQRLAATRH